VNIKLTDEELRALTGRRSMRLGDLIRRVTEAVGMKPCDGCKRRQKALNRFKLRF
jgi:hypothetical protein